MPSEENTRGYRVTVWCLADLLASIAQASTRQQRECADCIHACLKDGLLLHVNDVVNDKDFFIERTILDEDGTFPYFVHGLGGVRLDAFLPSSFDDTLSCLVLFREVTMSTAQITLGEDEIIETLFANRHKGISTDRGFIVGIRNEDVLVRLGNNRFLIDMHTVEALCVLVDELYDVYEDKKQKLLAMVGGTGFEWRKQSGLRLMTVPNAIWDDMRHFTNRHGCEEGDSAWHIFTPMHAANARIILRHNHHRQPGVQAEVFCQLVCERGLSGSEVYWQPGYTYGCEENEGFDNIVKWRADFTWEFLLNAWLPQICYNRYMRDYRKRPLIKRLLHRPPTFDVFRKQLQLTEWGIVQHREIPNACGEPGE